jgi:hypothetical protein
MDRWSSAEFLSKSDEKPFRSTNVAESICVFVLDYLAYELRAAVAEPFKRLVDIVHSKHHAEIAEGIYGGCTVIRNHRRSEETGEF